jgi:hypothetical protein
MGPDIAGNLDAKNAIAMIQNIPKMLLQPYHGNTVIPIDLACAITLLQTPFKLKPLNLVSDCLILAIS